MKFFKKKYSIAIFVLVFFSISGVKAQHLNGDVKLAFLADVHLQDIYGKLTYCNYEGLFNEETGKYTLLRTMSSQLHSTRIFNENYFAFLAALDQIAKQHIKLVALPGDYSDDGQAIHIRGLRNILNTYTLKYGMQFFITTGNHDPVAPFRQEAGKEDFLGEDGKNQPIFSKAGLYTNKLNNLKTVISPDIAKLGYKEIINTLQNFGFYPQQNYLYWATPFSTYSAENYSFKKAERAAKLKNRTYQVIKGFTVPDASYVVEPVKGIWLLALDGDVYIPKNKDEPSSNSNNYNSASLGYNNVLIYKKHLVEWVKKITKQAKKRGKTVIAFSHFPMVDFNDDATPLLKKLLGDSKWQLERVPNENVAEAFANAGLKIHVAGHMHINDTGIRRSSDGNTLVNIQTPSLAAYQPGYKVLTIHPNNTVEVNTFVVNTVPRFKELFSLYNKEYHYLKSVKDKQIWNDSILRTSTYHDFTLWHLKELVRLRFLKDWPNPVKDFLQKSTLAKIGKEAGIEMSDEAESYKGEDLLIDFYKLRNADVLALQDISKSKQKYYHQLINAFKTLQTKNNLKEQLKEFFQCLDAFFNGAPANHFLINLESGKVSNLE
ncbi:metallophosphoesterase [Zhouia sp. PK063]|uniref:metallophosphoesterase n=1 Tax=Zhouia sp. PK063 TaxID=3373602 RepID=UPI0037A59F6B